MSGASPEFSRSIFEQFTDSMNRGFKSVSCKIPVASLHTNRITLGACIKGLDRSPHTISLRKHPSGIIRVGVVSDYGLACPDPLPAVGLKTAEIQDERESNPALQRHAGFLILSTATDYKILGAGFQDDDFTPLAGVDLEAQNLFVAQIAGVVGRASRKIQQES